MPNKVTPPSSGGVKDTSLNVGLVGTVPGDNALTEFGNDVPFTPSADKGGSLVGALVAPAPIQEARPSLGGGASILAYFNRRIGRLDARVSDIEAEQ